MLRLKIQALWSIAVVLSLFAAQVSSQQYPEPFTQTKESNSKITPKAALMLLEAGNQRFMRGALISRPIRQQFRDTALGQYPFAVIASCQDSRTSSELMFDLNNGDAFSLKIAGNVVNEDILGGLEFGTVSYYAKVIAVIGHTDCGAIKGAIDEKRAIDEGRQGNLINLLRRIRPALDMVDPRIEPKTSSNSEYVTAVARANVLLVMKQIHQKSPIIKQRVEAGTVDIIGGMHNVATGEVTFFKQ